MKRVHRCHRVFKVQAQLDVTVDRDGLMHNFHRALQPTPPTYVSRSDAQILHNNGADFVTASTDVYGQDNVSCNHV